MAQATNFIQGTGFYPDMLCGRCQVLSKERAGIGQGQVDEMGPSAGVRAQVFIQLLLRYGHMLKC